jgi:uncharacterized membrane protein YsdA (DUF1294 family)/cold shock CspA family protein
MRFEGRVKSWNVERGFGFIEPTLGGQEVFLHISAVPTALRPPKIGQSFTFEVELNRDGRKRAANLGVARPVRTAEQRRGRQPVGMSVASVVAIPLFLAIFVAVAALWRVSIWVAVGYLVLSATAVIAYAIDKSAARSGAWRSSEQSLLLLGLAGGWPGAILAQQLLRHKTRKASFQLTFWGTVFLNVAGFVVFHSPLAATWRS